MPTVQLFRCKLAFVSSLLPDTRSEAIPTAPSVLHPSALCREKSWCCMALYT